MTLDEFEELGNKGITEITFKKEAYETFVKSLHPIELDENGNKIDLPVQDISCIHTTSGKIKITKEE